MKTEIEQDIVYKSAYYAENKDRIAARTRAYRAKHKEKVAAQKRAFSAENSEKIAAYSRAYYAEHKKEKAAYAKRYYAKSKEERVAYSKKYYADHKEERAKYQRAYLAVNGEKRSRRQSERLRTDLKFNLSKRMSGGIRKSLWGSKGGLRWESLIPYTLDDLIRRLKKTIPDGYRWGDSGLHIDHIIPISKFNYEKPEDDDFQRCWALSNLQLLPAAENMSKSDKLEKPFQPSFVFG